MAGIIGSDESGKGDYFGPLVVAAVFVPEESLDVLSLLGVKDSKRLSDTKALRLADELGQSYPNSIVAISPKRYNELYGKFGNLNRLLAWAHARAIENLLIAHEPKLILVDQFADPSVLKRALFEKTRKNVLLQQVRAEEHPAVALASILARSKFLVSLRQLGEEFGFSLPKGASAEVEQTARSFYQTFGLEGLHQVAKLHFKTTQRVVPPQAPQGV
ncbi:MAG: ribonuclease HIII [Nitrospirota bacterium]|nr:ribonuclease HIII [Nitrospirota bacterium]